MALAMPPAVLADTNVLYQAALRDILMDLALAGVIRLHWSLEIEHELARALIRARPDFTSAKAAALIAAMNTTLPDARVVPAEEIELTAVLPDPKDVHVLAAARTAVCSVLLTFNLGDFPAAQMRLEPRLEAMHPDTFLTSLLTSNAAPVLAVIDNIRRNLRNPPLEIVTYCANLQRSGLTQSATLLRVLLK